MTHERTKKQNKGRASEMNLAAILMCIVFLFFVCHFPRILLNVHEVFMVWDMLACGDGKWIYFQHANKVIHPKHFEGKTDNFFQFHFNQLLSVDNTMYKNTT